MKKEYFVVVNIETTEGKLLGTYWYGKGGSINADPFDSLEAAERFAKNKMRAESQLAEITNAHISKLRIVARNVTPWYAEKTYI